MIENLAQKLCESRHRWLIVTAVTFVIALASVLPQVDQFFAERSERTQLEEQLAQAQATTASLSTYEKRLAEKSGELARLRDREVDEDQQADLRSWLVNAARTAGCQVRRIDMAAPNSRPWMTDDDPIKTPEKNAKQTKTPFELQTRPVVFSVTGSTTDVLGLLKTIDTDGRLKHTQAMDLKPTSRNARELQLDLTLWYFALVRSEGAKS